MPITVSDFDFVRKLISNHSAICLEPGKEYLVEMRLLPVAKKHGLESLGALVDRLRSSPNALLHRDVVEAMTTNETFFFRDIHPFDALKNKIIPDLINKRAATRKLSFWCAASSTGQEPYSVAMLLREHFPALASWKIEFIATDLANTVLARAREGIYNQVEINRGLPASFLVKYFRKQNGFWKINDEIRNMVQFTPLNLLHAWPISQPLDIVFIRNVLIYFNVETKRAILGRIRNLLKPDGYLFLGSSETTVNIDDNYRRVSIDKSFCYQPCAK